MPDNISKLKSNIVIVEDASLNKDNTREAGHLLKVEAEKLQILRDIHNSRSLNDILEAEKLLLATELVKSREQERSIERALKEFNSGLNSLAVVEDKAGYKQAHLTYPDKAKDKLGLPEDAFRKFIDGHQTRLNNKLSNPESNIQAEILKQRQANLAVADKIYQEKQKEAVRPETEEEKNKRERVESLRTMPVEGIVKNYPDLAKEVAVIKAAEEQLKSKIDNPELWTMALQGIRDNVALRLEKDEKMPDL